MAPTYKLRYFNVTGLGEPIRYLLSYSKIDFEDDRIEFPEFEAIKPGLPFGQVPVLEIDGKQVFQSTAICRYLGKQAGLAGKNDWDALQIDIAADSITDYRLQFTAWFKEKDEDRKEVIMETIKSTHNPYYLSRLEKLVNDNGGFFYNGKLTWVDLFFAAIANMLKNVSDSSLLDKYPALAKLTTHVENLPGVKAYIAKRPVTSI